MSTVPLVPRPVGRHRAHPDVRHAWLCLAGLPVAVILAFVLGEAAASWAGVGDGDMASPGTAAFVLVLAVALLAIPTTMAWRFAGRALAHGDHGGQVPALILTVLAIGFIAVNLLSYALMLFG